VIKNVKTGLKNKQMKRTKASYPYPKNFIARYWNRASNKPIEKLRSMPFQLTVCPIVLLCCYAFLAKRSES